MSMMMERQLERKDSEERRPSLSSYEDFEERVPHQAHVNTKKEEREREKILQKKLGELATQIQRLERRVALLKTENDALKKKQDDQKPLEEKIRSLKKRNAELATIARRLEEKAKNLQQENVRVKTKTPTSLSQDEVSPDAEYLKRIYARQRAKELSEHAKNVLSKEKEIEDLQKKCQELADVISNGEVMAPKNAVQFEEKEELVNIIKQAAKERLQLEQQLASVHNKEILVGENSSVSEKPEQLSANEKYRHELEQANEILHKEIEKLEQALHNAGNLEQQLTEKSSLCVSLSKDLAHTKQQKQQLEDRLTNLTSENLELVTEVQDLNEQLKSFHKITEECNTLRISLASAQREREAAEEEVKLLNIRVHSLENVVRDLQESAEQVTQLDNEHKNALQQLQQKQQELEELQQITSATEIKNEETISALSLQVHGLVEQRESEHKRREELAKEVQKLKKEAQEQQIALEKATKFGLKLLAPGGAMERRYSAGESLLAAWIQKGPIQVYIAKYNYDPFEFSPNENPEAELPLTAGDYVLVMGEMDEDGFFDGELIDGRQGLVPSNFIEKVRDEDLIEFHAALLHSGRGNISNSNNNSSAPIVPPTITAATSIPVTAAITTNINNNNNNDIGFHGDESKQSKAGVQNNPDESFSDLEDIAEIDEDNVSISSRVLANSASANSTPPCPRSLSLDKQLTNSLLVSWKGPDPLPGQDVQSYHVLVDGQFKTSVKSNERTKALLEGVNSNSVHRVCIRCLSNKGQSKDAQCTMLVGKDVYPKPSEIQVSHLSPTSATLSWLPGNSNYQHSIIVNGKEVRTVKPGVYRHTLSGLTPSMPHKVTLIAKSVSGVLNEEKSRKWVENASESIEFYTPDTGAPEPPLNVQVESGPREGTLLLTWLPVTISSSGVCNGGVVSGYQVMADARKISLVAGPTSDHVVLSSEDFKNIIPSQLTVRTVSASGQESVDSEQVLLPHSLIKEMTDTTANVYYKPVVSKGMKTSGSEEHKSHDTDEEIEEAFREAHSLHTEVNAVSEAFSDSSCSELSDIPEVEEDLIASQDSRLSEVEKKGSPQPAPRKLLPGTTDTGPKEFHAQKPTAAQGGKLLAAPTRIVPAIEIIRDSSTERGTSADEDDVSTPSRHSTPTNISGKGRAPDSGTSSNFQGDHQNPSAFRQVDQTRHKDSTDAATHSAGREDGSQIHSTNGHPVKPQPHDSRPNRESQSPKHRVSPRISSTGNPEHRKHAGAFLPSPSGVRDEMGDNDSISGEINPVIDANTVRLFIALFDYDPTTMSPNVDSIDEELPFREGQILRVFGDKDTDGFYKGESHGRVGYIPCNMVSEVQIDDPEIVEQLLQETAERLGQANTVASHPTPVTEVRSTDAQLTPNGVASMPREGPVMRKMVAMYDYDPQELSPNVDAEMELSFRTGDTVMIYGEMDEDGFYTGEINGQHGLVPSNFLQPAPSSDDDGLESASLVSAARSRSGESLDAALSALARTDMMTNAPKLSDQLPSRTDITSSNKQSPNVSFSEIKSEGSRLDTASPADDEKPKKKGGFLNKSKNIFKKFTR